MAVTEQAIQNDAFHAVIVRCVRDCGADLADADFPLIRAAVDAQRPPQVVFQPLKAAAVDIVELPILRQFSARFGVGSDESAKQLLWHYSALFAYPFKSNEVPYHEIVQWIAEKKGVRRRELRVYNTFQLECRIFDKLLMPEERAAATTSFDKLLEQVSKTTEYLQETDLNRVTQAVIFCYNIKREVIEQYYDELQEKPKYPDIWKKEPEPTA